MDKDEEQQILQEFLTGNCGGKTRQQEIHEMAEAEVENIGYDETKLRQKVLELKIKQLKAAKTASGLSVFQDAFLAKAETMVESQHREPLRRYRETGAKAAMPRVVSALQKAEQLVINEVSLGINDQEVRDLAISLEEEGRQKEIERDLHLAVNKGLDKSQTQTYMALMLELRELQTANPTNVGQLKQNIIRAVQGEKIDLVHLKCPRYSYPHGHGPILLTHLDDEDIPTKDGGIYRHRGEEKLYDHLVRVKKIFSNNDLDAKLSVLLMDQDLEDHFYRRFEPINNRELQKERASLDDFKKKIVQKVSGSCEVEYLQERLASEGKLKRFNQEREHTLAGLYSGESLLPEKFVESRVDYRTETNAVLLESSPGRQAARDQTYSQLATLKALGVLGHGEENLPENMILVEEDRGDENGFIGGIRNNALPVFFTKLKDFLSRDEEETK